MHVHAHHHPVSAEAGELKDSDKHFIRSVTSALMQRMVEADYGMADYSEILWIVSIGRPKPGVTARGCQ